MLTVSLIVDLQKIRCGGCKVIIADELVEECPTCGALIDRIVSNHVGLASRLKQKRAAAGIEFKPLNVADDPGSAGTDETEAAVAESEEETAQIVVDMQKSRCSGCKVIIPDELAESCPTCGLKFDRVVSNHIGLAARLQERRAAAAGGKAPAKSAGKADATELVSA